MSGTFSPSPRVRPANATAAGMLSAADYTKLATLWTKPALSYSRSTAQAVASATLVPIQFDTALINNTTGIWSGTFPSRFTIPAAYLGLWLFVGGGRFAAGGAGNRRQFGLALNGGFTIAAIDLPANGTGAPGGPVLWLNNVTTAGTYVELYGYQDSGGALNTLAAGCWLAGVYLGVA